MWGRIAPEELMFSFANKFEVIHVLSTLFLLPDPDRT